MAAEQIIPVSAIDEMLAKVTERLGQLVQQARELEHERDMLTLIRKHAITPGTADTNGNGAVAHRAASAANAPLRLPTAQAIYHVVQHEPGLRQFEVVSRAIQILDSETQDARRLLHSAISNLKRKGRFDIDANGGLHIKDVSQERMPLAD